MKMTCHKCESPNAWVRKTEYDLIVVCFCGAQKLLFTTLEDTLEGPLEDEDDVPETKPKVPRRGTNLYKALMVLSVLPEGRSNELTRRLNELNGLWLEDEGKVGWLSVSDVSSYLTILRTKGLVERTDVKRGVPGGSAWVLTDEAIDQLKLEE